MEWKHFSEALTVVGVSVGLGLWHMSAQKRQKERGEGDKGCAFWQAWPTDQAICKGLQTVSYTVYVRECCHIGVCTSKNGSVT